MLTAALALSPACGDDSGGSDGSDSDDSGTSDGASSSGGPTTASQSATQGETSDPSAGSDGESGGADVPDNPYCAPAAAWEASWAALEDDVLELVNTERAKGANCGGQNFGPAPPLTYAPELRCAARVHSKDMVDRDYFSHTNPEGESPGDRIEKAGYSWSTWGENIAGGSPDAAGTMAQWMESPGHCSNIMSPEFTEIGVGYQPGGEFSHTWTQVFGRPG